MRVILFSCVVMVHTVGTINGGRAMGLLSLLMHYTRYGFVFVTVFVLFLGYYHKDTRATTFWRKRFGLVVLPYLVWSVFYTFWEPLVLSDDPWPGFWHVSRDAVFEILKGDSKYQMYFLLISMQIYFFFPALRWLVKKTEGHHGKLLVACGVIQLAMFFWLSVFPYPDDGVLALVRGHAWKALPTYALLVAMGALAAVHFDRTKEWFATHIPLVLGLSVLGTAFTVGVYVLETGPGDVPGYADSASNPTLIPWLFASIAVLYLVGAAWNDRRGDGSGIVARIVDLGSIRAFGVFAAHPLVIDILMKFGVGEWIKANVPGTTIVRSLLLVALVFLGCLVLIEVLLRTPLSKAVVARSRLPLPGLGKPRKPEAKASAPASQPQAATPDEGGGDIGPKELKRAEEEAATK
jgi:surface polysaccharide O-acyltransferase-like enzyme